MARSKKKKSRKRGRNNGLSENIMDQLRGMGFATQQIEDVANDVIDRPSDEQFNAALELLLANANNDNDGGNNEDIEMEPPKKRRRVIDLSDDNDIDINNVSSEEERKSQNDEAKKKTHVEIKEEEFNKQEQEMQEKENEYKKWEQRQNEIESVIISIRNNIQNLYTKIPKLPDTKDKEINKEDAKIEELLTERMQLYGIIEHVMNSMNQHIKYCNELIDEEVMKKEIKKQELEDQKERFKQSIQEFESEKFALQLMQNEVKSGAIQMTLVEHNLFIVASALNNASEEQIDNDHFKELSKKIKILQNKGNKNDNSNSKEEKEEDDANKDKDEDKVEFDCQICFCPYSELSEILIFDECYHYYCMNCLKGTLKVKLEDRNVKNINCPHEKCEHKLTHKEISYILTKEEFAKFDEYLLDKTLQAAKDCRFCPGVDCGEAMFGYSDSPMLTCPKCTKQFCFNCGTEDWHEGSTCQAFKKWKAENGKADVKFDEWVKNQNAKQCPNCNSFIEKNGGCDHMTCQNCKYEFHWISMEKWRGYGAQYNVPNRNRNNNNNRQRDNVLQHLLPNWGANNNRNNNHRNNIHIWGNNMHPIPMHHPNNNNNNNNNHFVWNNGGNGWPWNNNNNINANNTAIPHLIIPQIRPQRQNQNQIPNNMFQGFQF